MIRRARRGFTVVEMLISMTIMGLVLALAVVEFAMVFNHNNLTTANITAESNARISMAKVTNEVRQAMPDITDFSGAGGYPIVVYPPVPAASTAPVAEQSVSFYRVHNGAGGLTTPIPVDSAGDPIPCYDLVTLTYDPVAKTITREVQLKNNANCPTASDVTNIIAHNIVGFEVETLSSTLLDVDLQTQSANGSYGIYDLNTQVALGYKP